MKWTAAELLDTTRRRTGGGERGYGEGVGGCVRSHLGKELEGEGENRE